VLGHLVRGGHWGKRFPAEEVVLPKGGVAGRGERGEGSGKLSGFVTRVRERPWWAEWQPREVGGKGGSFVGDSNGRLLDGAV